MESAERYHLNMEERNEKKAAMIQSAINEIESAAVDFFDRVKNSAEFHGVNADELVEEIVNDYKDGIFDHEPKKPPMMVNDKTANILSCLNEELEKDLK